MPVLRRRELFDNMPDVVTEPFSDELRVAYVIDHESTIEYVLNATLVELGIEKDALRSLSVANFMNRVEARVQPGDGCAMIVAGGTYEASCVLIDTIVDELAAQCEGQLVACFPAIDMFVFADSLEADGIARIANVSANVLESGNDVLSREFFTRTDGEWLPWKPSPSSASRSPRATLTRRGPPPNRYCR